jgi:hypothetical protein
MKHIKLYEEFANEALSAASAAKDLRYDYGTRDTSDQKVKNDSPNAEKFWNKVIIMGKFPDAREKDGASASSLKDGEHKVYPLLYNGDGDSGGTTMIFEPLTLKKEGDSITLNKMEVDAKTLDTAIEFNNKNAAETKRVQGPGFKYNKEWHFLLALEK